MSNPLWKRLGFESAEAHRQWEAVMLRDGPVLKPSDAMVERAAIELAIDDPDAHMPEYRKRARRVLAAALGVEG